MPHRHHRIRGLGRAAAAAALLAAAAALGACGSDSNPFPPTDCCAANVYYICNDAASTQLCLGDPPQIISGCVAQGRPCPTAAAAPSTAP